MSRLGLRARVALATAVAIVLAVVLLAVAVLTLLSDQLDDSLDGDLRARAVEVSRLAATTPDLLDEPGALEGRLGGAALFVEVIDPRGRIIARSSGLAGRVLPEGPVVRAALRERRAGYGDATLGPDAIRLYASPLGEQGRSEASGGAVLVAGTRAPTDDTLDRIRSVLVLAGLAAVALAAGLAVMMTRRALVPLARLSSGARAIARSPDAAARLPEPASRDEVGELAETLNAMLASLQRAREAEQRFVGDASHELRTPLTALRGNAAYVARHGADPEVLADIEADAARMGELLDDLLALARLDAAAPASGEPIDLAELAREAGADRVLGDGPLPVSGERHALERALGNLVANARRHGQGAVTIELERAGERARVSVSDEGRGLERSEAAQAFERFWRGARARGEGSGLGLAIVRAIAERHNGRVEVVGARFTIELPALKDLSEGAPTTSPSPSEGPRR